MARRPSRALARSFALALSLILVGSTLALPAAADDDVGTDPAEPFGIILPEVGPEVVDAVFTPDDTIELRARAQPGFDGTPLWALRQGSPARSQGKDFTRVGNVDGFDTDLELDDETGEYFIVLDLPTLGLDLSDFVIDGTTYPGTAFFFVFNTGGGEFRDVREFAVSPLADFDDTEIETCNDGEECSITAEGDQTFTTSTPDPQAKEGQTARLGLRIPDDGDSVSNAVFDACQGLLARNQRLGGDVAQLVPVGFAGGNLTVTNFIPRSVIRSDVNRGTSSFQICVAPTLAEAELYEAAGYGDLEEGLPEFGSTGLVGPILLDDCDSADQTACVESRERQRRANLLITFRIPAADPWMM